MKSFATAVLAISLVSISNSLVIDYTSAGSVFQENFDGLPSQGVNNFTNGTTVNGLWAFNNVLVAGGGDAATQISSSSGDLTHGGFFSLGSAGSSDRAFGSISGGNNTTGPSSFGLAIRNRTGHNLTEFKLGYWGEQWTITTARQGLQFSYLIAGGPLFTAADSTYTRVTSLDFGTPDWGAFGPLNGNAPQNRTFLTARITGLQWQPNQVLNLRWLDPLWPLDPAMGIDDLTFEAVPEPFTMTALGLGLAAIARKRARKS